MVASTVGWQSIALLSNSWQHHSSCCCSASAAAGFLSSHVLFCNTAALRQPHLLKHSLHELSTRDLIQLQHVAQVGHLQQSKASIQLIHLC